MCTVNVDTYLKSPYFFASNGEYYTPLRSFSIFDCYPGFSEYETLNDRTVKVVTYLENHKFSASNGK